MGTVEPEHRDEERRPPVLDYAGPRTVSLTAPIWLRGEFAGLWVAAAGLPFGLVLHGEVPGQILMLAGGGMYCLLRIGLAEDLPRWAKFILTPLSLLLLWSLRSTTGYDGLPFIGAFQLASQVGWHWAERCYSQITWLVILGCDLGAIVVTWAAARLNQRTRR